MPAAVGRRSDVGAFTPWRRPVPRRAIDRRRVRHPAANARTAGHATRRTGRAQWLQHLTATAADVLRLPGWGRRETAVARGETPLVRPVSVGGSIAAGPVTADLVPRRTGAGARSTGPIPGAAGPVPGNTCPISRGTGPIPRAAGPAVTRRREATIARHGWRGSAVDIRRS